MRSVRIDEIEAWAAALPGAARTVRGRLQYVRLLFAWGAARGYCERNPALAVDLPDAAPEPPGIHTPEEARRMLMAALADCPGVARALAVRYFAGLRSIELLRLAPECIRPERGHIEVTAAMSKTRRRRLVRIAPNLAEWLRVAEWWPGDLEKRIARIAKSAGVPWPHNVTRHSWVSYHLALHENAGRTALEAGHSEQMLFAHYRELVTREAAEEFFGIRPLS